MAKLYVHYIQLCWGKQVEKEVIREGGEGRRAGEVREREGRREGEERGREGRREGGEKKGGEKKGGEKGEIRGREDGR